MGVWDVAGDTTVKVHQPDWTPKEYRKPLEEASCEEYEKYRRSKHFRGVEEDLPLTVAPIAPWLSLNTSNREKEVEPRKP